MRQSWDRGFEGVQGSKKEQDKVLGSLCGPAQLTSPRNAGRGRFLLGSEREGESHYWGLSGEISPD